MPQSHLPCVNTARKGTSWIHQRVKNAINRCKRTRKTQDMELSVVELSRSVSTQDFVDPTTNHDDGCDVPVARIQDALHSSFTLNDLPFEFERGDFGTEWIGPAMHRAARSYDSRTPILGADHQLAEVEAEIETQALAVVDMHVDGDMSVTFRAISLSPLQHTSSFSQRTSSFSDASYYSGCIAYTHANSFHHSHANLLVANVGVAGYPPHSARDEVGQLDEDRGDAGFPRRTPVIPLTELIARANADRSIPEGKSRADDIEVEGSSKWSSTDEDIKVDKFTDNEEATTNPRNNISSHPSKLNRKHKHSIVLNSPDKSIPLHHRNDKVVDRGEPCYALLFASRGQSCVRKHVCLWDKYGALELGEQGMFAGFGVHVVDDGA